MSSNKAWRKISSPQLRSSVYGLVRYDDLWVFRGLKELFGWDPVHNKIIWKVLLKGDEGFGYRDLIKLDEIVITSAHKDSDPENVWIKAFKSKSGQLVWEKKVKWRLNSYFGGLNIIKGQLVIIEDLKSPQLIIINADTGKVSSKLAVDLVPTRSAVLGESLFYACPKKGLFKFSLNQKDKLIKILEGDLTSVISRGNQLYALARFKEDDLTPSVVWFNNIESKKFKQLKLPGKPLPVEMSIIPTSKDNPHQLLLIPGKNNGICMVDFELKKVLWHQGQKQGWHVRGAVWTPYGVVISVRRKGRRELLSLDSSTGEILGTILAKRPPTHILYWKEPYLVVDTSLYSPEIFKWVG